MGDRPPSISDVAALAGVSRSAVSFALNGRRKVSEATRQRILEAARELGYSPNHAARSLKTGRSRFLGFEVSGVEPGVLVPSTAISAYFAEVMNGAAAEALASGWFLVVVPGAQDTPLFRALPLDGGIVLDPVGGESLVEAMRYHDRPWVTIGRPPRSAPAPAAVIDNDHNGMTKAALDHLRDNGYARPALLLVGDKASYVQDIRASYSRWCRRRSVAPLVGGLQYAGYDQGIRVTAELLASAEPPDSFVAVGDQVGLGVLEAVKAAGLRSPHDVGVLALTGVNDTLPLKLATPRLTVVDMHAETIGRNAVQKLIAILEQSDADVPAQAFTLHPNESTAR